MTLRPRRTIFQLTPLLDLLLIVIFAQFMATKKAGEAQEKWFDENAQTLIEKAEAEQQRSAELEQRLSVAERRLESVGEREREMRDDLQHAKSQRDALAQFTSEVLKLPDDVIDNLLKDANVAGNPAMKQTLEAFRSGKMREAIKHVMSYAEILKRCDLWEVYLDYLPGEKIPRVSLTAGGKKIDLAAETADAFRDELFNRYKEMPQPKSLVIVLFGYDKGSLPFGIRKSFSDALRESVQKMNEDSFGRTRFYASDLGDLLVAGSEPE